MVGICWALVRAGMREEMQFRANFLIEVAFGLVYQTIGFAFIWVVLGKFQAIGGCINDVQGMVQEGEFDTMLVRPMPIALQFMFGGFRIAIVGNVVAAMILLGVGLRTTSIDWTLAKAVFLVLAVTGSGLVRGAFELAGCALVFRSLVSGWVQFATDSLFGQFGAYPLDIFARRARQLLTYVIPVAFVAWVPSTVLLDRTDVLPFPAWIAWCTPVLGAVLMAIAWWLFLRESRQYQSSGS